MHHLLEHDLRIIFEPFSQSRSQLLKHDYTVGVHSQVLRNIYKVIGEEFMPVFYLESVDDLVTYNQLIVNHFLKFCI